MNAAKIIFNLVTLICHATTGVNGEENVKIFLHPWMIMQF